MFQEGDIVLSDIGSEATYSNVEACPYSRFDSLEM